VVDLGLPKLSGIEVIRRCARPGARSGVDPHRAAVGRTRWKASTPVRRLPYQPFQAEELHARIHALLRRAAGVAQPVLRCGPITLDIAAHTVQVDNRPLELTGYEYKVLEYLMLNRGKVISKTELTEHVYDQISTAIAM